MPDILTAHDAFLAGIIESPDDDFPRLQYADWLEERGDVRGEFVRVQCELAAWKIYKPPAEIQEIADSDRLYSSQARKLIADKVTESEERLAYLRRRERELLRPHWHGWAPSVKGCARACGNRNAWSGSALDPSSKHAVMTFRRGFVDEVRCRCEDWIQHGPAIVRQQPVRVVRLAGQEPYDATRQGSPWSVAPWRWSLQRYGLNGRPTLTARWLVPNPLAGGLTGRTANGWDWYYATRQDALDDLSDACLKWAKEEASRV